MDGCLTGHFFPLIHQNRFPTLSLSFLPSYLSLYISLTHSFSLSKASKEMANETQKWDKISFAFFKVEILS